jgi:AhpD family alkylhydroperoxidase
MFQPREMLQKLNDGQKELAKTNPELVNAFAHFTQTDFKTGAVDGKTKELIAVGVSLYARCEHCVVHHVYKALELGATPEEIRESAFVAIAMGGGPSMTYLATLLNDAITEFAPDFQK